MAKRVVLHIGAMKSGTSFVQNVLDTNRAALREHGIAFACPRWRLQVLAVRELSENGGEGQPPLPQHGHWQRLVDDVQAWPGTSIISMEYLAPRRKPKIDVIRRSFPDADLQVVLTARDLGRSIPAMWTETVQNRGHKTWPEFLELVRSEDRDQKPARWFWSHQRISQIAARWAGEVGHDHFTLITVPPKGAPPSVLWDRFAEVVGIPAGLCDLEVRSNPGIDAASALVLRALNERLEETGLDRRDYERFVKGLLAKRGLVRRGRETVPLGLDERWVRKRSRADVDRLRELGVRVVGDLDELRAQPVPGVHTRQVTAQQQLEAAVDGLAFLVTELAGRHGAGSGSHRGHHADDDLNGAPDQGPGEDTGEDPGEDPGHHPGADPLGGDR